MVAMALGITTAFQEKRAKVKSLSERPQPSIQEGKPQRFQLTYISLTSSRSKKSSKVKEKGLLLNQGAQLDNGF